MTVRVRLIALALVAGIVAATVGCGPEEIKDPKKPADAPTLKQQIPAGGGPGGGGGGKPGQGNQ